MKPWLGRQTPTVTTTRLAPRDLSRRDLQELLTALQTTEPARSRASAGASTPTGSGDGVNWCAACVATEEEERRWLFFYETESNSDDSIRARLTDAGGLCAPHTRRLAARGTSSWLAKSMFDVLVRHARSHPGEERTGSCPMCDAVDTRLDELLALLSSGLTPGRPGAGGRAGEVADAYRLGGGLCIPHARRLVGGGASPAACRVVADTLVDRLGRPPEEAVSAIIGADPDGPARLRLRTEAAPGVLAQDQADRSAGIAARIDRLLTRPCCAVCAAQVTTVWRMLDWIGSGRAQATWSATATPPPAAPPPATAGPATAGPVDAGAGAVGAEGADEVDPSVRQHLAALCTTHLADLVHADGDGGWLSAPVATVVRLAVGRWREAAQAAAEAAASPNRYTSPADSLRPRMTCPVCAQADESGDRAVTLMHLVAADPARTAGVVGSHGPCERCRPRVAGAGTDGVGHSWELAARARTAELAFELGEARRMDGWSARWDVRGAEMAAWRRAPGRLDGIVLGPPAPVEPADAAVGSAEPAAPVEDPPADRGPAGTVPAVAAWETDTTASGTGSGTAASGSGEAGGAGSGAAGPPTRVTPEPVPVGAAARARTGSAADGGDTWHAARDLPSRLVPVPPVTVPPASANPVSAPAPVGSAAARFGASDQESASGRHSTPKLPATG